MNEMTDNQPLTPCGALLAESVRRYDLVFFTDGDEKRVTQAKSMCAECFMVSECLQIGMNFEYGIFGGLTPSERKSL